MARIEYKGKILTEAEYKKKKSEDDAGALALFVAAIVATCVFLNLPGMALYLAMPDSGDVPDTAVVWVLAAFISLVLFVLVRVTAKSWKSGFLRYAVLCAAAGGYVASGALGSAPDLPDRFAQVYFPDESSGSSKPVLAAALDGTATGVHRVRSGDYLGRLAKQFGTTVAELQRLNGLHDTTIHVGQELRYPRSGS